MKTIGTILSILTIATMTGCGSKSDANQKNFGAALEQDFEKNGDLCLSLTKWPFDVPERNFQSEKNIPTSDTNRMAALEAFGLVNREDIMVDDKSNILWMASPNSKAPKIKVKQYTLSDKAKPFVKEKEVKFFGTKTVRDLCWSKMSLGKVVKWEGPLKLGDYQEVSVYHTYKLTNFADWAKTPEVQAAFPLVKSTAEGVSKKELKHVLKLTSEGWESRRLN